MATWPATSALAQAVPALRDAAGTGAKLLGKTGRRKLHAGEMPERDAAEHGDAAQTARTGLVDGDDDFVRNRVTRAEVR